MLEKIYTNNIEHIRW